MLNYLALYSQNEARAGGLLSLSLFWENQQSRALDKRNYTRLLMLTSRAEMAYYGEVAIMTPGRCLMASGPRGVKAEEMDASFSQRMGADWLCSPWKPDLHKLCRQMCPFRRPPQSIFCACAKSQKGSSGFSSRRFNRCRRVQPASVAACQPVSRWVVFVAVGFRPDISGNPSFRR